MTTSSRPDLGLVWFSLVYSGLLYGLLWFTMVIAEVQRLVQSGLLWFSLVQHPGLSLMTSTMMCPLTCNYDWPRKGPIAIVRSAARRGADRTARARCVQQTNINSLNFCLPQLAQFLPGPLRRLCLCPVPPSRDQVPWPPHPVPVSHHG